MNKPQPMIMVSRKKTCRIPGPYVNSTVSFQGWKIPDQNRNSSHVIPPYLWLRGHTTA